VKVIGTNQVIRNVSAKDLITLEVLLLAIHPSISCKKVLFMKPFSQDSAVFYNSWLGVVEKIKFGVKLKCSDGSMCWLPDKSVALMDDNSKEYRDEV
jgi:hypothetical protein